jgi:hypothetical protein
MSQLAVNTITNAAGGNTAQINGMTPTAESLQGFRNRLINGGMVIDQRNAGASVTITNNAVTYTVDRWQVFENGSMSFTAQQSSTAPAGFSKSLIVTSTAAVTPSAADRSALTQVIEGLNIADLGWGAAGASSVTLSFWVRSSLTGQFGGSLQNSAQNYSYPFAFTVNSANTFEYKTVTIEGPTAGTFGSDNGGGIRVAFDLGMGSDLLGTAGAWVASDKRGVTGDTRINGTNGATFYITGVQLEAGSVATPFERRPFGQELALCQRYGYGFSTYNLGVTYSGSDGNASTLKMPVTMRATPSLAAGATYTVGVGSVGTPALGTTFNRTTTADCVTFFNSDANWSGASYIAVSGFLSAEL